MAYTNYLAEAHSGDYYCDGAVRYQPKHKKHTNSIAHKHHHNSVYASKGGYNPYSTQSRAQIDRAIASAIRDAHSGSYFCDGAIA